MIDLKKEDVEFLVNPGMIKEVKDYLDKGRPKINFLVKELIKRNIDDIFFVGCGSSNAVGGTLKYFLDKYSKVNSDCYTGREFIDNTPYRLGENSAVFYTSHTGNTKEIARSIEISKSKNALNIGNTKSRENNFLGENAEVVLDYNGEAGWVCQLLGLYLTFCDYIKETEGNENMINPILEDISNIVEVLEHNVSNSEKEAKEKAQKIKDWKGFYTIASGPLFPLAYKVGVITNMEFIWSHGSAINSGEFNHGPIEIVEEGIPFLFLIGTDSSRYITQRVINFVEKKKGDCIVFDYKDYSLDLHPDLSPIILYVPLEWFSYYYAVENDHNPDETRYYGSEEF